MDDITARAKMVVAMEYIARQVNDEEVFQHWLMCGVADGDIDYGSLDENKVDPYYVEDDNFRELMDTFLRLMEETRQNGGLYCGNVVTEQG